VAPIIIPIAFVYYTLHHLVFRYQFLYVYATQRGSAGRAFPIAIGHMFTGIYIQQLTLLGLVLLNNRIAIGAMLGILVAITITANVYLNKGFGLGTGSNAGLAEFVPLDMLVVTEEREERDRRRHRSSRISHASHAPRSNRRSTYHYTESQMWRDSRERLNSHDLLHVADTRSRRDTDVDSERPSLDAVNGEREHTFGPDLASRLVYSLEPNILSEIQDLTRVFYGDSREAESIRPSLELYNGGGSANQSQLSIPTAEQRANPQAKHLMDIANPEHTIDNTFEHRHALLEKRTRDEIMDALAMQYITEGECGEWEHRPGSAVVQGSLALLDDPTGASGRTRSSRGKNGVREADDVQRRPSQASLSQQAISCPNVEEHGPCERSTTTTSGSSSDPFQSETAGKRPVELTMDLSKVGTDSSGHSSVAGPMPLFPQAGAIMIETTTVTKTKMMSGNKGRPRRHTTADTQTYVLSVPGKQKDMTEISGGSRRRGESFTIVVSRSSSSGSLDASTGDSGTSKANDPQPSRCRDAEAARGNTSSPDDSIQEIIIESSHQNAGKSSGSNHAESIALFDDSAAQSHPRVVCSDPHWPSHDVMMDDEETEDEEEKQAQLDNYTRPRFRRRPPVIWVPRDEFGRAEAECRRLRLLGIPATCLGAELVGKKRRQRIRLTRADAPTTSFIQAEQATENALPSGRRLPEGCPVSRTTMPDDIEDIVEHRVETI
jgi:hypothetical protein